MKTATANTIEQINSLNNEVRKLSEYHYRIENLIDLFPVNRRYHILSSNKRGQFPETLKELQGFINSVYFTSNFPEKIDCKIMKETCVPFRQEEDFTLPKGAKILKFDENFGNLVFWYLADINEQETQIRTFVYLKTDTILEDYNGSPYINTVQIGNIDYHIFERLNINRLGS